MFETASNDRVASNIGALTLEARLSRPSRPRLVVLLATAFALSILAGAFHLATEQHDFARATRGVRAATIAALPCHAPAHRSHACADHDCVLAAEEGYEVLASAELETDETDGLLTALELVEIPITLPVPSDDSPPEHIGGSIDRSRGPPSA